MDIATIILYSVAGLLLILSVIKDKKKTVAALKKAWKAFENILPQFLTIIMLVGVLLAIFDKDAISRIIGKESGFLGVFLASVVGAITLIPGFIAFPTAALLLQNGAGYSQIAAFISSLMMVGVVTMPVEIRYFGKKVTLLRNLFAYAFSFLVAFIIGWIV
jgi:uncharacterized membrane protein YraQ (UPF0718 family)